MHTRIKTTIFSLKKQEVSIFIVINGKLSIKSFKVETWIRNVKTILCSIIFNMLDIYQQRFRNSAFVYRESFIR